MKAMKRRLGAWGLIGLLAAVLAVAVIYSRSQAQQPQAILEAALAQGLAASSAKVSMEYQHGTAGGNIDTLVLSGGLAIGGRFDVSGSYERGTDKVGMSLRSPDGGDAYLRLNNMNALGRLLGEEAADYGITAGRNPLLGLDSRWLTVPAGIKDTVLQGGAAAADDGKLLDESDRRRLGELFRRNRFLTVQRQLTDEIVEGQLSYHYRLGVSQPKLEAFMRALRRDVPRLRLTEQRALWLQDNLQRADRLEIWISQADRRPVQMQYHSFQVGETRDLILTIADYGKPLRISKPPDVTPLFEALQTVNRDVIR